MINVTGQLPLIACGFEGFPRQMSFGEVRQVNLKISNVGAFQVLHV
jgi:hypothetical protein